MRESLLSLLWIVYMLNAHSQSAVGIGTATPHSSAALEITATDKGVLIPRVSLTATGSASPITSPATGLLIYNTNVTATLKEGFYYWTGTAWESITSETKGAVPKGGIIEFEERTTIPGYTYLGSTAKDINLYLAMSVGSWTTLPAFPHSVNNNENCYGFYNNQLFVWSGQDNTYAGYEQTGGIYNVSTNTWSTMSTTGAPAGRYDAVTVTDTAFGWMLIWGGVTALTASGTIASLTATGGVYDMIFNSWTTMAASPLAARYGHAGVFATGNKLLIWGGKDASGTSFSDGAIFNQVANSWTTMAASPLAARWGHSAVWTGTKMIIWGGTNGTTIFNDGATYDPATNTWQMISNMLYGTTYDHTAVWTGTEMITYGGTNVNGPCASVFRYLPSLNVWVLGSAIPGGAYSSRTTTRPSAVWTGTEMVVAGGTNAISSYGTQTVAAYNPTTNTWRFYAPLPTEKKCPAIAWTGSQVLIQSGSWLDNNGYKFNLNTGTPQYIEASIGRYYYMYKKD